MKNQIHTSKEFAAEFSRLLEDADFRTNWLFELTQVRDLIVKDRYHNVFDGAVNSLSEINASTITLQHNSDPERMFYSEMSRRPDLISRPLSCLNTVVQHGHEMDVLTVGCRTEAEIFSLVNAGFNLRKIKGVDLFSYTPLISLGDVTNLAFPANYFDLVVCGWVLEFVPGVDRAISELKRVVRPGGLIAIGGMHHPNSINMKEYSTRKQHDDRQWFCSIERIKQEFRVNDSEILFKSEIKEQDLDQRGDVVIIFEVKK